MSDVFDQTGIAVPDTTEAAPTRDWTPMADSLAAEDKGKVYDGNDSGSLREAAKDLTEAREAATRPPLGTDEDGILTRKYQYLKGESAGEAIPTNQTITAERAARDVEMMRNHEASLQQPPTADVANAIDAFRNELAANPQAPAQPDQAQAQPQAPTTEQAQPQDPANEIRQVLEQHPQVRQALEAELAQVEQHRAAYAQAARQSAQVAGAALFADHPELASLTAEQWPHALAAIAKVDPAKAVAIEGKLNRVQALANQSRQAEAAERQIHAARFQEYARIEDARFEKAVANEPAETKRAVLENGRRILNDYYGIDAKALAQAVEGNPALRAAGTQA